MRVVISICLVTYEPAQRFAWIASCGIVGVARKGFWPTSRRPTSEGGGDYSIYFQDFCMKTKARIWPWLSYVWHIGSTAEMSGDNPGLVRSLQPHLQIGCSSICKSYDLIQRSSQFKSRQIPIRSYSLYFGWLEARTKLNQGRKSVYYRIFIWIESNITIELNQT